MAVEAKRGCGYRKIGGLYLVGSGMGVGMESSNLVDSLGLMYQRWLVAIM